VPLRDATALAAAIRRLLDDPHRRRAMAAEARRDAVERFDLVALNDQWVCLYSRLVGGPSICQVIRHPE
jgi:glycosyltransferase involved in cell wall biosynthesis